MARIDTMISAESWNGLVAEYRDRGGREATDFELAEMIREWIERVEG